MKKIIAIAILILGVSFTMNAQDDMKKMDKAI